MRRHGLPWQPLTAGAVEWTDGGSPRSSRFDDVYYSRDNGLEESAFVFLRGNQLPSRWQYWSGARFCIGETGFGTGLNFLLTWQAWRETAQPRPDLHYLSLEKYPLSRADITRALAAWPQLGDLAAELLAQYPGLIPGQHRLLLEDGKVTLDLWWEDVAEALPELARCHPPCVDAWYLDGFAPARNADMWQEEVLRAVAALSRPGASFSTFTAAGEVRRQLARAGFSVEKVPGYGSKRECLRGRMEQPAPAPVVTAETPWDLPDASTGTPATAIVLGAGLAGCTMAAALARRGIRVTLLERDQLAAAGSGNDQGVIYTRMSREHSALADFSLQSFLHASTFYRSLFAAGLLTPDVDGNLCGAFQQDPRIDQDLADTLASIPEFVQVLCAQETEALLGVAQPAPGYWFPRSGWLHPAALCRLLAGGEGVSLREHCGSVGLRPIAGGWRATTEAGQSWEAPCVVIAAGTHSTAFAELDWLPLQAIRGQTTRLPSDPTFGQLRAVLCHDGYIAPARAGSHCIGATFDLGDDDPAPRAEGHRRNLDNLAAALPAWSEALRRQDTATLAGRVGFRCASPDYLPFAGPVPDRRAFLHRYGELRGNARKTIPERGSYLPGLYLSAGHGSRGLSSTPLVAELLASQVCGELPPLGRELSRALAPARFIIRDLSRNRI